MNLVNGLESLIMVSYLAHDKSSGLVASGGFHQVAEWSRQRIANKAPRAVIAIIKCRPTTDGRVIAEFTCDGSRVIERGRTISWVEIVKLSKCACDG